jgi:PTS system mannose-specific IID component
MKNEINKQAVQKMPGKITARDLHKTWFRWWWANEIPHSFDRYVAPSLLFGLMPILRKVYTNEEDLKEAYQRHMMFFNTQAIWGGGTITGIVASLEETRANQLANGEEPIDVEMIQNTKVGLMGALAGIGDAIDSGTVQYIFIAIALPWATAGSAWGALFPWIGFTLVTYLYGFYFTRMGYRLGRSAATELVSGAKMKGIIEGLSVLGLFMMGIIAANYVSVTSTLAFKISGKAFALQTILDGILPGLLPILVVIGTYMYFQKKGLKITKALLWLTLALGAFGGLEIILNTMLKVLK